MKWASRCRGIALKNGSCTTLRLEVTLHIIDKRHADGVAFRIFDGRVAGHLGDAVGLRTLSIHVCVCPHFGM